MYLNLLIPNCRICDFHHISQNQLPATVAKLKGSIHVKLPPSGTQNRLKGRAHLYWAEFSARARFTIRLWASKAGGSFWRQGLNKRGNF